MPRSTMQDFDPNEQQRPWGLFVPYRTPEFKVYRTRGHALSAGGRKDWILYNIGQDGKWYEVIRRDSADASLVCQGCGGGFGYNHPAYYHDLVRYHGKVVEPLQVATLCTGCRA